MGLFTKTKNIAGWLVVSFREDGFCVAHVKRSLSAKPEVTLALAYPGTAPPPAVALEKLAKEWRADRCQCTTLLANGEYQLLSVDAPNVPPAELKTAIRWRLKDMLDFHIDDATIDVLDIPLEKNAAVRNHSMYAVAARNQLIEQRQALFGQAKIPLSVIDIPEMAQRNISALLEPKDRGVALLSFDVTGGLLTVTFGGELYLSRRIDVTLEQLLQSDSEKRNAFYDRITLELQRSLDHFDRQYHFITLAKLVLAPLSEDAAGLREYLAANLYIPIESLNLESLFDVTNTPELHSLERQQHFFLTLGASLRHEEKVL